MTRPGKVTTTLLVGAALYGFACTGSIGDDPGTPPGPGPGPGQPPGTTPPGTTPPATTPPGTTPPATNPLPPPPANVVDSAAATPLRRLTIAEYNNTIRDLLGATAPAITPGSVAVDSASDVGYLQGAAITTSTDARGFLDISEKLSATAGARLAMLLPQGCAAPAANAEQMCATNFVDQFGLRAFRRPLTAEEKSDLQTLYSNLRAPAVGMTFPEAIRGLIMAMIQSPYLMYRWEVGAAPTKDGSLVKLSHYEIASRISYFVTATMPDDALFQAAARNELYDGLKVAEHVRRLLMSPKARDGIREFALQWLDVLGLPQMAKDEVAFPNYNTAVADAMLNESSQFVTWLLQGSGKLEELFTSTTSFVNQPLSRIYGITGVTGNEPKQVMLNAGQRAGILTHGSFLAAHAEGDTSHPIKRGAHIMRKFLCINIEPPDIEIPPVQDRKTGQTTRQRFEEATTSMAAGTVCQSCHRSLNPLGFALENFDAVGAYRTNEDGTPVDPSGTVTTLEKQFSFKNAIEFSAGLSTAKEVRDCMTRQFLRYVLRRSDAPEEAGSVAQLTSVFETSGFNLRDLMIATARTKAFTHRLPLAGEGQP